MKTRTTLILSMILLTVLAAAASAQPGRRGGRDCDVRGQAPRFERLCDRLDLTEDQQTAIDAIREKSRAAGLETRKQIMRLQNELDGLRLQDDPDAGDMEKLIRRIGELRTDQRVRRMETRLAVRAELTDEQRDQMMSMGGKRGGRGGRGHGQAAMGRTGGRALCR